MQRNKAVDAVKGVAILLVMLGHCIVLNGLNETDPYIYDVIKSVQMPLFMLVSGVLASYSDNAFCHTADGNTGADAGCTSDSGEKGSGSTCICI